MVSCTCTSCVCFYHCGCSKRHYWMHLDCWRKWQARHSFATSSWLELIEFAVGAKIALVVVRNAPPQPNTWRCWWLLRSFSRTSVAWREVGLVRLPVVLVVERSHETTEPLCHWMLICNEILSFIVDFHMAGMHRDTESLPWVCKAGEVLIDLWTACADVPQAAH